MLNRLKLMTLPSGARLTRQLVSEEKSGRRRSYCSCMRALSSLRVLHLLRIPRKRPCQDQGISDREQAQSGKMQAAASALYPQPTAGATCQHCPAGLNFSGQGAGRKLFCSSSGW